MPSELIIRTMSTTARLTFFFLLLRAFSLSWRSGVHSSFSHKRRDCATSLACKKTRLRDPDLISLRA
ncbi:hypothetical protein HYQ46_003807 [Verticillium longisporum]|nr:hypothetical protein HYQ46_003807 [Verticillium longisporum]